MKQEYRRKNNNEREDGKMDNIDSKNRMNFISGEDLLKRNRRKNERRTGKKQQHTTKIIQVEKNGNFKENIIQSLSDDHKSGT